MAQKYIGRLQRLAASLLAAAATVGASMLGYPTTATAEPAKWDPDSYSHCVRSIDPGLNASDYLARVKWCCAQTGGIWVNDDQVCVAPSTNTSGSRQLPGNIRVPSDIATVPVTQQPPHQVPPELASEPAVAA